MTDGLLLLHAFPIDARMWEPQLSAFSGALPVVAPHLPGFGGSAPAGEAMTMSSAAERTLSELDRAGIEVLYDDRDERAGVKFKDADLVGIPIRLAIGKKGLASGQVEWKLRASKDKAELVPLAEVAAKAAEAVRAGATR